MDYEKHIEQKASAWGERFVKSPVKTLFIAVILLGAIGFGISIVGGVFSTASSVISAPGRVIQETMKTDNIIESYEWFYDVNAAFTARSGQVTQFKSLLREEEDKGEKRRLRIEMAAMQQSCRELTTKYNANSEKMNKSIFKGWSLPDILNTGECE